jgi:dethiobiotin synthetase
VLRGIFVTGTDTNVGKTVTCAALLRRYRDLPLRYWKPVQTGIEQDDDTGEVQRLSGCGADRVLDRGVRLRHPVSPHLAARLNGSPIDLDALTALAHAQSDEGRWIVEGAGGVLVPLDDRHLIVDLVRQWRMPALIAARSGLGTINHTLLTIEGLRHRAITIAAVVMVGAPDAENRLAIERYGCVPVVGELPALDPLTPGALCDWADRSLDPDRRLMEYLG